MSTVAHSFDKHTTAQILSFYSTPVSSKEQLTQQSTEVEAVLVNGRLLNDDKKRINIKLVMDVIYVQERNLDTHWCPVFSEDSDILEMGTTFS